MVLIKIVPSNIYVPSKHPESLISVFMISATIQHAIGIPDAYIMQRGGWGNDAVLKNVYRHVMEEKEKEMNKKANDYFSALCNTKCSTK